jgi:hypothetical protein
MRTLCAGGACIVASPTLTYGSNNLWPTPVKLVNLLEERLIDPQLHEWAERYADDPRLLTGSLSALNDPAKVFGEEALMVFGAMQDRELEELAEILVQQADQYIGENFVKLRAEHEKRVYMWFSIQRPNVVEDPTGPHCHETSDVTLVYYLAVPENGSGTLVMIDPRGCTERGGRAFLRPSVRLIYTPRRGDLLLLPRYLVHFATTNTDTRLRKVIAGTVAYDMPRQRAEQMSLKPPRTTPVTID